MDGTGTTVKLGVAPALLRRTFLRGGLLELRESSAAAYVAPCYRAAATYDDALSLALEILGCDCDHAAASCLRCHP